MVGVVFVAADGIQSRGMFLSTKQNSSDAQWMSLIGKGTYSSEGSGTLDWKGHSPDSVSLVTGVKASATDVVAVVSVLTASGKRWVAQ